jgi:hypothetical protein
VIRGQTRSNHGVSRSSSHFFTTARLISDAAFDMWGAKPRFWIKLHGKDVLEHSARIGRLIHVRAQSRAYPCLSTHAAHPHVNSSSFLHIPASLPRLGQMGNSGAKDNRWDVRNNPMDSAESGGPGKLSFTLSGLSHPRVAFECCDSMCANSKHSCLGLPETDVFVSLAALRRTATSSLCPQLGRLAAARFPSQHKRNQVSVRST